MPEDENANWLLKVESSVATGKTYAEVSLADSKQGVAPALGGGNHTVPVGCVRCWFESGGSRFIHDFSRVGKRLGAVYRR